MKKLKKTGVSLLVLLVTGCHQVSQSIRDTFNKQPAEAAVARASKRTTGFVTNGTALDSAELLLRKLPQYRLKRLLLYSDIHFYDDGRIIAKLQHPENPEYVDAYTFQNGRWSEPTPVQLSVHENIPSRLIALDSVPLRTAAAVAAHYNQKAALIEGAEPTDHVYLIIHHGITRWYPNRINGLREAWDVYFHLDGNVSAFSRR